MPTPDDRLDAIDNIKEKISLTVQESVEILGGMISDFCENSLRDVEYRSPIILMKGTKRNHGPLLPQSEKILSNLTYNIGKIIMTGGLLDQLTTCSMSASKNKACSFVKLHHNFHKILANLLPVLYPTQCKERQMKHFKEDGSLPLHIGFANCLTYCKIIKKEK
ncbi:uncharacterized protein TRIADDRAFT_60732 [Trichoplax adhaerens]|uniref:Uncharacterized protein n=1 Tax=Trichoplax adhaerens TaxID=10228 RepID=B3S982_TRIAD|nr:predicted protein [Trichoplax adhaerens]EDV20757.1 predicted protein [Trichoplax adhaerens]|eukprot:XP_002116698.1 predicted protein [Trichoplax adhaerens]